jgi:hypothetical protein
MTIVTIGAVLGALATLLTIATIVWVAARDATSQRAIGAQNTTISAQSIHITELESRIQAQDVKALAQDAKIAALERENETLRSVVTAKQEIQALAGQGRTQHDETIVAILRVEEALKRVEEALKS